MSQIDGPRYSMLHELIAMVGQPAWRSFRRCNAKGHDRGRCLNMLKVLSHVFAVVAIAVILLSFWFVIFVGNETGTVSGKVTFKGQPLPSGLVVLVDRDDNHFPARILGDGSYATSAKVPCGPMKVTVGTTRLGPLVHPEERVSSPGYVRIPRHYADPDKSGIALDVKRGSQVFTIDLTDDFEPEEQFLGIGQ